uniref:Uncharacterized protein n=1 Tax=Mantoniella antarctica TaxID=81844 RepID=A0A7S0S930_9CHLO|mmetsp:Transcript_13319/g.32405  ORF Transcript_13319/g.32405 Transcript_13319/m.32405 type:complete len:200 (+) Transcript_13319:354-953(+)
MDKFRPLASQGLAYGQASLDAVEEIQHNAAGFMSKGLANVYGGGAGGGGDNSGYDVADAIAKRNKHFVSQFTRRVGKVEDKVGTSSALLRGQVLNSVIMADANAKSEIPALARALAATAERTGAMLAAYEARSHAMPALRYQLLEVCAEKKLQMERRYLAEAAPVEDRHAAEVKAIMDGRSAKVQRKTQPPTPSLLGFN